MLLTGEFSRSIDQKHRVAIPRRLRETFATDGRQGLYLAPGTDRTLALYAEADFARLAERLAQASPAREDVRTFNRLFYARAQRVELDSQGRIRLPPELAELAQLEKEVVLLGVRDHVEIWAAEHWRSYLSERRDRYDEIAEAAFR